PDGLKGERGDVEPLVRARVVELRTDPRCVGTIVAGAGLGAVRTWNHVERKARGECENRIQVPASGNFAYQALIQVPATLSDRHGVDQRSDEGMLGAEGRSAALAREEVGVLGI